MIEIFEFFGNFLFTGAVAGCAMLFQRSSYISLYTLSKTLEVYLFSIKILLKFFDCYFLKYTNSKKENCSQTSSPIWLSFVNYIVKSMNNFKIIPIFCLFLFQLFYMNGIQKRNFPYIKHFDTILYTICTGLMFHAVSNFKSLSPHNNVHKII